MKVGEAKQLAVDLISRDVGGSPLAITFDTASPDGDAGKFVLDGRPARAIHHFDGWYVPINLGGSRGASIRPSSTGSPFTGTYSRYLAAADSRASTTSSAIT